MSEKFIPPEVRLGDVVYWYEQADRPFEEKGNQRGDSRRIAIVSRMGFTDESHPTRPDSIELNVFDPNMHNQMLRTGVRHIDDPRARQVELRENGAWEHTERTKQAIKDRELLKLLIEFAAKNGQE
jgi:hypothetical protein